MHRRTALSFSLIVLLVTVAALLFRIPLLSGSFWLDEAAQALESVRPFQQQFEIAEDFQPPLLHLLVHAASYFSHSEWWLRLIGAVIPGLLTIVFAMKLAERLFSRHVAVITGLLLATSSFHVFYSQELRPYALAAVFALYSWWVLIAAHYRVHKSSQPTRGQVLQTTIVYALSTAAGLYSTYLYPFVVLSQGVYALFLQRKQLKQFLLSWTAAAILYLPWLPKLWEQLQVGQALRSALPGWEAVVAIPQLKSLPLTAGKFIFGVLDLSFSPQFIIPTMLLSVSVVALSVRTLQHKRYTREYLVLVIATLVPLLTAWLVSFFIPILQPKRVLYLLPFFYIGVAALSWEALQHAQAKTKELRWQVLGAISLLILLSSNIWSLSAYYTTTAYQREDWRSVYTKITTEYPTDSVVVFAFSDAFAPWRWYDTTNYPVIVTGTLTTADTEALEVQLKEVTEYSYVFVFDYLRDLTDPDREIETVLEGFGYSQRDVLVVPNIGFIRLFARQEAVLS